MILKAFSNLNDLYDSVEVNQPGHLREKYSQALPSLYLLKVLEPRFSSVSQYTIDFSKAEG